MRLPACLIRIQELINETDLFPALDLTTSMSIFTKHEVISISQHLRWHLVS